MSQIPTSTDTLRRIRDDLNRHADWNDGVARYGQKTAAARRPSDRPGAVDLMQRMLKPTDFAEAQIRDAGVDLAALRSNPALASLVDGVTAAMQRYTTSAAQARSALQALEQ